MIKKQRLDQLLHALYPLYSRTQIQSWIMQGQVTINDLVITKVGTLVPEDAEISLIIDAPKYVSRAGVKLEHALDYFEVDVTDKVILDAGLSTGGFTDCLLQHGAKKVYGIDVGYGQVHEKIRTDARVIIMERVNVRFLTQTMLPELVDLGTLDLSFISVLKVIEAVKTVMKPDAQLLVLIKPQFEARREQIGKGGVIKDPAIHQQVLKTVINGIQKAGFVAIGVTESPIEGSSGNKEFLAYFHRITEDQA